MTIRFKDNWGIICIASFLMVTLIYVIVNAEKFDKILEDIDYNGE